MEPLIILSGPTSVGKTELSLQLAERIGGEIISADSMQVYRTMDIGTAKLMPEDRRGIPHYGIDCVDPKDSWDVTRFVTSAEEWIREIRSHGSLPIVAGGTGFYIQALLKGLSFENEPGPDDYTKSLEEFDNRTLHEMLRGIDPESADAIPEGNRKRVLRALVYEHWHGEPISALNKRQKQSTSPYNYVYFVLTLPREELYATIDARVLDMINAGLVDEVKNLAAAGMTKTDVSMQGIGYRQILAYLDGEITLPEAIETVQRETRHFAKRQMTWFRRENDVIFLDRKRTNDELLAEIEVELRTRGIIAE